MSESRLSTSLITYGESLLRLADCRRTEQQVARVMPKGVELACKADTKAAEDVFHVAADELAEAWRAEFKDVAMQLVAAIQPNNATETER